MAFEVDPKDKKTLGKSTETGFWVREQHLQKPQGKKKSLHVPRRERPMCPERWRRKEKELRAVRGGACMCHDAKHVVSETISHPRVKAI